ncbi:MAG: RHS repeat protein, partial [Verrucomicrobiae bacterium]|nr:RHS repeat protein [Verrucomicrobiae bacterium]
RTMRVTGAIPPARLRTNSLVSSSLNPPLSAAHFHVLVAAPGSAGRTLELGLESVNHAGRPLANLGNGFAPVRAVSAAVQERLGQVPRPGCGAPIRSLTAWRMSDDPKSKFYNRFLSRPFALVANERVSAEEIARLQEQLDREILWSGAALRAFIDPSQANVTGLGAFAARVDDERKLLHPVAMAMAVTLDAPYVMGDNPPPAGGAVSLPGTFDSISAHSGEFRTEATDLELPGPRMPIVIERAIGNQDTYEGPFGVGWDFNYGQRITELDPQSFPVGLQMPVLARANAAASEIAGSQDVLFQTGSGRTILFKWKSTNTPPEYAADPLVTEFDYPGVVSDYFLPEERQGVFDLLVKFKDGRFERLTPGGARYRYGPEGRLEVIIDRFPRNRHELEYDRNGWLVRIDDRSVSADRYVRFGYYRRVTDPDFVPQLDEPTANPFVEGKVCRLRDYAGRDVLFFYDDDGFLIRREGVQVGGENGGFAGRNRTQYNYRDCKIVGVTSGANGVPLFNAEVATGAGGQPVAQAGTGASRVQFSIPLDNSAASLDGQASSGTQADGRSTEIRFDALGHPTLVRTTGGKGDDSETKSQFSDAGLMARLEYPEGRVEMRVYDTNNPSFRSRGNLLSVTVDPGPRGGDGYTETFNYDPRYNLPSGAHRDANGFTHTYAVRADGRAVASVTRGASGEESSTYDDHGQLRVSVDIRGVRTEMTYDGDTAFPLASKLGDHTTTFGYDGTLASRLGRPSSLTPPAGAATQMKYNAMLQVVETERESSVRRHGYDERGHEIFTAEELGEGQVRVIRRVFDEKGFMTRSATEGVEVDGTLVSLPYIYTPDELSRVKVVEHPGGTRQSFEYDKRNEVIQMTVGSFVEEYRRDRHGNLLETKRGGDVVSTTEYDGFDRPKQVLRKTGTHDESVTSTYFPGGQTRTAVISDPAFGISRETEVGAIDELGRPKQTTLKGTVISPTTTFEYLPLQSTATGPRMAVRSTWSTAGYPLRVENPIKTLVAYPDAAGRVEQVDRVEDGFTYKEFSTFNGLDQVTTLSDLLGLKATFAPRADGHNLSVSNARSHATRFEYTVLGEPLLRRRADGLEFRFRHDPQRQLTYTGDPAAGHGFSYDEQFRLTQRTQRDGQPVHFQDFDPREMPQRATLPGGGAMTMEYDLQQRVTRKTVSFQGTAYETTYAYDAAGRPRVTTYRQDGGAANTATMTLDPSGVLVQARYQEAGADFAVNYTFFSDGARRTVVYPSGHIVTENRDVSGRLLGISDASGNILSATAWRGHRQPREVTLGNSILQVNQFDDRGRLTASRFSRLGDNAVLAHLRFQFDAANNVEAQQSLHRGGRTDFFTYDNGERVSQAQIGAIPLSGGGNDRVLYQRTYNFNPAGLDFLETAPLTGVAAAAPAFATNWTAHDAFLLPGQVNGFNRGDADPLGRVASAELFAREPGASSPTPIPATLIHNGRGDLVRIERSDGVVIENLYQPNGLRFFRRVTQDSRLLEARHYVYDDQMRLLEEYDRSGDAPALLARYYYGNDDAPVAADLWDFDAGALNRFYYLRDGAESVAAVADAGGNVVERVWYDPFGQPVIEQRDTAAPVLRQILAGEAGALLLPLSETVSPPVADPGAGEGIVRINPADLSGALTVSLNSNDRPGTVELLPELEGYAPWSVLRFTPAEPLPDSGTSLVGWWPGDAQV